MTRNWKFAAGTRSKNEDFGPPEYIRIIFCFRKLGSFARFLSHYLDWSCQCSLPVGKTAFLLSESCFWSFPGKSLQSSRERLSFWINPKSPAMVGVLSSIPIISLQAPKPQIEDRDFKRNVQQLYPCHFNGIVQPLRYYFGYHHWCVIRTWICRWRPYNFGIIIHIRIPRPRVTLSFYFGRIIAFYEMVKNSCGLWHKCLERRVIHWLRYLLSYRYRKPHSRDVTLFTFFARHRHQGWLNIGGTIKVM